MTPRVLIFTPLLRSWGRPIVATHQLIQAAPCPVEWLAVAHDQPYGAYDQRNVLHLYQLATKRCRDGGYTHLLCLEDDMVAPADTITRLLAADAPVAYGLYCWRRTGHSWSAYQAVDEMDGCSWGTAAPEQAARWLNEGAVVETAGVGLGCALIRTDVLRDVPWRMTHPQGVGPANDWYFAVDCQAAGVTQAHDFGVVCGHMAHWPSMRVIWPAVMGDTATSRYEYIEV